MSGAGPVWTVLIHEKSGYEYRVAAPSQDEALMRVIELRERGFDGEQVYVETDGYEINDVSATEDREVENLADDSQA